MRFTLLIFLAILLADTALADDPHGVIIQQGSAPIGTIETSQAMALAVSEINPTLLSSKWQLGIGFGSHNDETAIAIGGAKRVNKTTLFSVKAANQGNSVGLSFGLNIKLP